MRYALCVTPLHRVDELQKHDLDHSICVRAKLSVEFFDFVLLRMFSEGSRFLEDDWADETS